MSDRELLDIMWLNAIVWLSAIMILLLWWKR